MDMHGRQVRPEDSITAIGPYVGRTCQVSSGYKAATGKCTQLARWAVHEYDTKDREVLTCGKHLITAVNSLTFTADKAIMIQQIPVGKIRTST